MSDFFLPSPIILSSTEFAGGVLTSRSKISKHSITYHTLAHLASNPSVSFCISPATWLNSAAEGHCRPTPPLLSPDALTRTHREAAYSVDQRLNFILNGTQHPGSMKWSLIIKLKSLSAEQFKWRQLSASLLSFYFGPSLSPASSNLIENPHSFFSRVWGNSAAVLKA